MAFSGLTFPVFSISEDPSSAGVRWKKWLTRLENFLIASNVRDGARQRAMLLHFAGEEVFDIFETLPDTGDPANYRQAAEALTAYFTTKTNVPYERLLFRQSQQTTDETVDAYVSRLRRLASTCNFPDVDDELKTHLIHTCISDELRRKALRSPSSTLDQLLEMARTLSISEKQASSIETKLRGGQHESTFLTSCDRAPVQRQSHQGLCQCESISQKSPNACPRVYQQAYPPGATSSAQDTNGYHEHNERQGSGYREQHREGYREQQGCGTRARQGVGYRQQQGCGNRVQQGDGYLEHQTKYCYNCGGDYPHRGVCPARNIQCNGCLKIGHFQAYCRSGKFRNFNQSPRQRNKGSSTSGANAVAHQDANNMPLVNHVVNEEETQRNSLPNNDSSDESIFIAATSPVQKQLQVLILIGTTYIEMLVDTGASVNILTTKAYNTIRNRPPISPSSDKIYAFGSACPLQVQGVFYADATFKERSCRVPFYVLSETEKATHSLLSYSTSVDLRIIQVINAVDSTADRLVCKYPALFQGVGKLEGFQVKLHVKDNVKPVAQKHRRIPYHLRTAVETELKNLEAQGIIEKAVGPTPWVSPIVVVPRKDSPDRIRICVDLRAVNEALERERHIMPTVDDVISELSGATVFSKLDLNNAYHQLELAPESRYLTVFSTHAGLFRYCRVSYGLSVAPEIFQQALRQLLQDIQGSTNIMDDVLAFGKTQSDHDTSLDNVCNRLQRMEKGLTVQLTKCTFNTDTVEFYGNIFSKDGVQANPKVLSAIQDSTPPVSVKEVKSFLGMASYLKRFVPDFSTLTEPLRRITKKGTTWNWEAEQQQAFLNIKDVLAQDTTLSYFDPAKRTLVIVDASPVGLGSILTQTDSDCNLHIVAYASRALTAVEQRYSQTEKEALSIVWSCEHFHLFLLGSSFTVITDHKPLEMIFNNPCSTPPARIERWRLRLQSYNFDVVYKRGDENPADYLSRHPVCDVTANELRSTRCAELYINFVTQNTVPHALQVDDVRTANKKDESIQAAIESTASGIWYRAPGFFKDVDSATRFVSLSRLANELATHNGLLLRGLRLVIPKSLEVKVIRLAHQGHQGIVKTKQLMRKKVWFPNMDATTESVLQGCLPCKATHAENAKQPLEMSELPSAPWTQIAADFCGPFPTGEYLLVIVDEYSRFPIVEMVHSTNATSTLKVLRKCFATFGIPEVLKTDNGPPFSGTELKEFAQTMGFKHRKITPYWPQANAQVERFMKTIAKCVNASVAEGRNWKSELDTFLLNYRATPHSTTECSPALLMFQRELRTTLPQLSASPTEAHKLRERDAKAKQAMKKTADSKLPAYSKRTLKVNDKVILRRMNPRKTESVYDPNPLVVTEVKGNMITAKDKDGKRVTRNVSFFKYIGDAIQGVSSAQELKAGEQRRYNLRSYKKDRVKCLEATKRQ